MENSVLIWTENKELMTLTEKVIGKLGLQLKEADCATDLIAIPCFYIIIDAPKLNKESIELLHEMAKVMYENEQKILLISESSQRIPKRLQKFIKRIDNIPLESELMNCINDAKILNPVYKRKILNENFNYKNFDHTKKRIFRVWYIYNELKKKDGCVNAYHYSTIFDVSDKTIHRDIDILRDFECNIIHDAQGMQGSGYYLKESF